MPEDNNGLLRRMQKQIEFIIEIDKVKSIIRKSRTFHNKRYENDAEHGWHISVMALVLAEYSNEKVDIAKVIKMALIHDLVEIDAGDTLLYAANRSDATEKERQCAKRIFGILPEDQYNQFMALWEEFEAKQTPEAKFAGVMDRLEPLLQNFYDNGHTWQKHNIPAEKVFRLNQQMEMGSKIIWDYARSIIEESIKNGYLERMNE
ncbi:MAG TPA: HD domain-containing protein [Chitinispirillaceae bacterium]|nr:HD domain-containing protein [Chitinispirillaceae bacterium]